MYIQFILRCLLPPRASLREFTRIQSVFVSQLDVQWDYLWGTLIQEPELWVIAQEMCSYGVREDTPPFLTVPVYFGGSHIL